MSETISCKNMINGQLKICGITNENVIRALKSIKRSTFVPKEYKNSAYIEESIPLPEKQEMLTPLTIGKILQALNIQKNHSILQIGSGSGYLSAVLSKLGNKTDVIEYYPSLTKLSQDNLQKSNINSVKISTEDASCGIKSTAIYDNIIITASMPKLIERYLENLKTGGKLIAILGESPSMKVTLLKKLEHKKCIRSILFETEVLKMINIKQTNNFDF